MVRAGAASSTESLQACKSAPLPFIPRSNGVSWSFSQCNFDDYNGYSDAADAWLRKRGVNIDAYNHK